MVVTYYIKLFRTGADEHNGIFMSLLLLVQRQLEEGRMNFRIYFLKTLKADIMEM